MQATNYKPLPSRKAPKGLGYQPPSTFASVTAGSPAIAVMTDLRQVTAGLFDLDIHPIPARGANPRHDHYDLRFLVEADDTAPVTVSEESHDLAWVDLSALGRYTEEASQHRMARKTAYFTSS